ncbi:hypothetical protein [Flammeovirga aprica]|uniref:SH3b domain-containing protein n=1 Tax=Flammeovirga aprica JL-4 TaxID=694437 RepID=A0A7X9RZP1_9BACT|nr:hypothetical protein [Flammeovirga aprica]NME71663.1 hypothetical protein [Flammeovirga aprica JL-4]
MKTTLTTLLVFLCLTFTSFAQENVNFFVKENNFDWSKYEIEYTEKLNALIQKEEIEISEYFHPIYLNNDSFPDFVYEGPYEEAGLEGMNTYFYISSKRKIEILESANGQILHIRELGYNQGKEIIVLDEGYCGATDYQLHFIYLLYKGKDTIFVKGNSIIYSGLEGEIPDKLTLDQKFIVLNDRYNLRDSPQINEENITDTYNEGNTGLAVASKIDDTGREWWFVIMDCRYGCREHDVKYHAGWMSSRYLEKIEGN